LNRLYIRKIVSTDLVKFPFLTSKVHIGHDVEVVSLENLAFFTSSKAFWCIDTIEIIYIVTQS
jgi:hypothetical protein